MMLEAYIVISLIILGMFEDFVIALAWPLMIPIGLGMLLKAKFLKGSE